MVVSGSGLLVLGLLHVEGIEDVAKTLLSKHWGKLSQVLVGFPPVIRGGGDVTVLVLYGDDVVLLRSGAPNFSDSVFVQQ